MIIQKLASYKPRSIIFDKLWALPVGLNFDVPVGKDEGLLFVQHLQELDVPLTTGAFYVDKAVKYRQSINLNTPDFLIRNHLKNDSEKVDLSLIPIEPKYFYGPQKFLRQAFAHIGIFNHSNYGRAKAFSSLTPFSFKAGSSANGSRVTPLSRTSCARLRTAIFLRNRSSSG